MRVRCRRAETWEEGGGCRQRERQKFGRFDGAFVISYCNHGERCRGYGRPLFGVLQVTFRGLVHGVCNAVYDTRSTK